MERNLQNDEIERTLKPEFMDKKKTEYTMETLDHRPETDEGLLLQNDTVRGLTTTLSCVKDEAETSMEEEEEHGLNMDKFFEDEQ